jgi:hypothetical protein
MTQTLDDTTHNAGCTSYQPARAPDGLTAAAWKKELKARYPVPADGACREVPAELEQQLEIAGKAASYWADQVALIKARIRQEMGGAGTATINGVPFMVRSLVPYKGYDVAPGFRDTLAPPPKDED